MAKDALGFLQPSPPAACYTALVHGSFTLLHATCMTMLHATCMHLATCSQADLAAAPTSVRLQASKHAGAIQRAFEYFAERAALGFIIPEWLPTPDNQQYAEAVRQLDSVVYSIIDSRTAQLAANSPEKSNQVGPLPCSTVISWVSQHNLTLS